MGKNTEQLRRAQKYVEIFEEGWQQDHREAMEFFDCQERVTEAVSVFRIVSLAYQLLRMSDYRGIPLADCEGDVLPSARKLVRRWLESVEVNLHPAKVEKLERQYGSLDGATELRECVADARGILEDAPATSEPKAIGVRYWQVDEDEAEELRRLANAKPGDAGVLRRDVIALPVGDASLIR